MAESAILVMSSPQKDAPAQLDMAHLSLPRATCFAGTTTERLKTCSLTLNSHRLAGDWCPLWRNIV